MAVTSRIFGNATRADFNFLANTVRVMLCTSAYTPSINVHRFRIDVTNEVVGTGYTAGGQALIGKTSTYDATNGITVLSCDNISWAASTITARYAVFYVDTADPLTSPLLALWDFGADQSSSSGPFDLTISTAGLLQIRAS